MLLFLKLINTLLTPFLTGFLLLSWLDKEKILSRPMTWGVAYGIGTGLLTFSMFLQGALHVPFGVTSLSAPLYFVIALCLLSPVCRKRLLSQNTFKSVDHARLPSLLFEQKIVFLLVLLFILYHVYVIFWLAFNIPVFVWDAIAIITFKAKIFFYNHGLVPLARLPHPYYPLHIPLLQTWVAVNLGFWDEQLVKMFFPFTFIAYLSIHYSFLKEHTNFFWATLGTGLVVSSYLFDFFAAVSYRDFTMLYYNCTTIMLLILWKRHGSNALLSLAGFFSGMVTFTKLEGSGYFAIHLLIAVLMIFQNNSPFKIKLMQAFKFFWPAFTICAIYATYKIITQVPSSGRLQLLAPWENLDRIPQIFKSFGHALFLSRNWNILWFMLVLSFTRWTERPIRSPEGWLGLTILLFLSMYFFIALLTPTFYWLAGAGAYDVLPRVILHFFPLAPLLITLLIADEVKIKEN